MSIMNKKISIRLATHLDSENIWHWRNDNITRKMSRSTDLVDWKVHEKWFSSSLLNKKIIILLGTIEDLAESIGMIRFDLDENEKSAEISINLNPLYRDKKISKPFLEVAILYFRKIYKIPIIAEIKITNAPSIKSFEDIGFKKISSDHSFSLYRYEQK